MTKNKQNGKVPQAVHPPLDLYLGECGHYWRQRDGIDCPICREQSAVMDEVMAIKHLMEKAHADHCAVEQRLAQLYAAVKHGLTVIAECCEENHQDWLDNGYETAEPIEFAKEAGQRTRALLDLLNKYVVSPDAERTNE